MRYIPSLKTLRDRFGEMLAHDHDQLETRRRLQRLRKALERWRDRSLDGDGKRVTRDAVLELANDLLGGHGVELIRTEADDHHEIHGAEYVNMGDTYAPTLLFDHERCRFEATDYGTWVELAERRGVKIP